MCGYVRCDVAISRRSCTRSETAGASDETTGRVRAGDGKSMAMPCPPIIVNAGLVYFAPNAIGRRSGFFGP
jgi:hypothetical protein